MTNTIPALIAALCMVESSNNPRAIGDGGKAIGILQIHSVIVDDVNRILSEQRRNSANNVNSKSKISTHIKSYKWPADCYNPVMSSNMAVVYFSQWPNASAKTLARRWNGGPRGDKKPATLPYWNKVSKYYKP